MVRVRVSLILTLTLPLPLTLTRPPRPPPSPPPSMARPQRTRCCCPWPPWPRRLAHGGRAPPRVAQRCSSWRRRPAPTPAPAALPPPHPLRTRSGLAPRPSLHGPAHHLCVTLAPPRTLPAPFLHPSCTLPSAGAAGHAAAHSRCADRWRPKRQVSACRRVRRSCASFSG